MAKGHWRKCWTIPRSAAALLPQNARQCPQRAHPREAAPSRPPISAPAARHTGPTQAAGTYASQRPAQKGGGRHDTAGGMSYCVQCLGSPDFSCAARVLSCYHNTACSWSLPLVSLHLVFHPVLSAWPPGTV
uniref:Uncharacterized protein n=1 Tax=Eutreptiella gymnastica TaxID=73025 RepID=A0A7S4G5E5_9EUGL